MLFTYMSALFVHVGSSWCSGAVVCGREDTQSPLVGEYPSTLCQADSAVTQTERSRHEYIKEAAVISVIPMGSNLKEVSIRRSAQHSTALQHLT